MPPVEYWDLDDYAVVWPAVSYDGYGEPVLGTPFEVPCRWVGSQTRALDPQGQTITVDATMILPEEEDTPGAIPIGSVAWHGRMVDLFGTGTLEFAQPELTLMQVKVFNSTPDYRNREQRRSAGMMRYNQTLPKVVRD